MAPKEEQKKPKKGGKPAKDAITEEERTKPISPTSVGDEKADDLQASVDGPAEGVGSQSSAGARAPREPERPAAAAAAEQGTRPEDDVQTRGRNPADEEAGVDRASAMTVEQKVERLERRAGASPSDEATEPAGRRTGAEGEPGLDDFREMVEGYPDSFWEAVEESAIDKPMLMSWNEWQIWRKEEGGLPKGVRGSTEQKREVEL